MPSTFCCDCHTSKQHLRWQVGLITSQAARLCPRVPSSPAVTNQVWLKQMGLGHRCLPVPMPQLGAPTPIKCCLFFSAVFSNQLKALVCLAKGKWRCIARVRGGGLDRSGNRLQLWDCTGSECALARQAKETILEH